MLLNLKVKDKPLLIPHWHRIIQYIQYIFFLYIYKSYQHIDHNNKVFIYEPRRIPVPGKLPALLFAVGGAAFVASTVVAVEKRPGGLKIGK